MKHDRSLINFVFFYLSICFLNATDSVKQYGEIPVSYIMYNVSSRKYTINVICFFSLSIN